jgi:hypothetical protein
VQQGRRGPALAVTEPSTGSLSLLNWWSCSVLPPQGQHVAVTATAGAVDAGITLQRCGNVDRSVAWLKVDRRSRYSPIERARALHPDFCETGGFGFRSDV